MKIRISELGVSQLYINERKLSEVKAWVKTDTDFSENPLPVCDFGNGKYTLTDGHTRAVCAYLLGAEEIGVRIDNDEEVTSEGGRKLYEECIKWCEEEGVAGIAELSKRIITDAEYQIKWIERCGDYSKQINDV